ncbi:MAG TPA: VOC family protein [Candidatus Binatia bacterium]|nr:VOC family protein [Candidatus Binatia bacterium]
MEVLGFDHIDLTVNDPERWAAFYAKILGHLGFKRVPDKAHAIFANAHVDRVAGSRRRPSRK